MARANRVPVSIPVTMRDGFLFAASALRREPESATAGLAPEVRDAIGVTAQELAAMGREERAARYARAARVPGPLDLSRVPAHAAAILEARMRNTAQAKAAPPPPHTQRATANAQREAPRAGYRVPRGLVATLERLAATALSEESRTARERAELGPTAERPR